MKKPYQHFKKSSFLSAENLTYLELNQENYPDLNDSNKASSLKDDVIKSFNNEIPSNALPKLETISNGNILASVGYRFANISPLSKPFQKEDILKGLSELGYHGDISDDQIKAYCGTKALDIEHIADMNVKEWLYKSFESKTNFSKDDQIKFLKDLVAANDFEKYLDLKFVGQKRFSLEGNDSLIPCLNRVISQLPNYDYKSISMGMAHRGRLNVLLNVCGMISKSLIDMFSGQSKSIAYTSGDVKYHLGFESVRDVDGAQIPISLANNPSHLEFITPVVMGEVRAKQKESKDQNHLSLTIHGDAAFSGQGTVMESVSMSNLPANTVGGTLHIVLDNQIGFTNDKICDMRSSFGCADIAKMIDAPILYANADDPESCIAMTDLALAYIAKYRKSAFIVMIGYRRHGHNEGDEPSMTSPHRYSFIAKHDVCAKLYADQLISKSIIDSDDLAKFKESYKALLDEGKSTVENTKILDKKQLHLKDEDWRSDYSVEINKDDLISFTKHIATLPDGFKCHRSIDRILKQRMDMAEESRQLDWGMAELLAYATLLSNGHSIRINGQDAQRGTFSHRHAVLNNLNDDNDSYSVLSSVSASNATFDIYNSLLSEQGILGFEYGYSLIAKKDLVLWEAQFGDFANGAQVIIDQFISSGMQKWLETSKLVMLLPHGYEGMGPEHTSGRMERFLQLCAQKNIQVCNPTTPGQMFHLLLRQYHRNFTRPLIVMTPKSLLRHPKAGASYDDLVNGSFKPIIENLSNSLDSDRVILCTGKVYYDLLEYQEQNQLHIPIIRLEQLYPLPDQELRDVLKKFKNIDKFIWCQEEPINQGAWFVLQSRMNACLPNQKQLTYVGRDAAASPAVGYHNRHLEEQAKLVKDAFEI